LVEAELSGADLSEVNLKGPTLAMPNAFRTRNERTYPHSKELLCPTARSMRTGSKTESDASDDAEND
jgi:hypothetical protein